MKLNELSIAGMYLIELKLLEDERGSFARLFSTEELATAGEKRSIVQVNQSYTRSAGTVRGMHYQAAPHAEAKYVRCMGGAVSDVVVDLRKDSSTFLKVEHVVLSATEPTLVRVPEGCAHGFQTLSDNVVLLYLHTELYRPQSEGGVRFDDPRLSIVWPREVSCVSERDRSHPLLTPDFEGLVV